MLSASSRRADQLREVLEPTLRLDGALLLELDEVARAVEQRLQQRRRLVVGGEVGHPVDQLEVAGDPLHRGAGDAGVVGAPEGVRERQAPTRRVGVELADARVTDAALGCVEDPLHGHLVLRVDHRLQVGERVLDLPPVVEAGAADHLVRHAHPGEVLLHHPALGVGAVEDGDVGPAQVAAVVQLGDLAGDPLGFVHLVVAVVPHDRVAVAPIGPQLLGLAAEVVADDGVGGVEDRLRRPVVLLQHHDRDVRKGVLELEDVPHVRSAELVDRLVAVAHDADVAVLPGEEQDHLVLDGVGVLVLVDHDVLEAAAVALEHVGVVLEEGDGVAEQVVEVHRPGPLEPGLVLAEDVGDLPFVDDARPAPRRRQRRCGRSWPR